MGNNHRPLTQEDKENVFRIATRSLPARYSKEIAAGMTDEELISALEQVLGIFGGSDGPDRLSVTHKGAGLKIWGGWHIVNHVTEVPLLQGKQSLAMARLLYGITDPANLQMDLF